MVRDRILFVELDESLSKSVENANKTESNVLGKGKIDFTVRYFQANLKKCVPEKIENMVSVIRLTRGGDKAVFGTKSFDERFKQSFYLVPLFVLILGIIELFHNVKLVPCAVASCKKFLKGNVLALDFGFYSMWRC